MQRELRKIAAVLRAKGQEQRVNNTKTAQCTKIAVALVGLEILRSKLG